MNVSAENHDPVVPDATDESAAPAAEAVRLDAPAAPGREAETTVRAQTPLRRSFEANAAAAEDTLATLPGDAVEGSEFRTAEPASGPASEFADGDLPERGDAARTANSGELVRRLLALHARIGNAR